MSLRGLGAGSTLVLINGRRIAPYGLADDGQKVFTDLSIIPLEAVERVEVLKDGASSIYGSDAIAGVVNIILRKDFTGAILKGSYGISGDGDGNERKASITWAPATWPSDGYNFFISVEASRATKSSSATARTGSGSAMATSRRCGYDPTEFGGLFGFIPTRRRSAAPATTRRSANPGIGPDGAPVGNVVSLQDAAACAQLSTATIQDPNGGCVWDSGQFLSLKPEQQYVNVFSRGTFALSDTPSSTPSSATRRRTARSTTRRTQCRAHGLTRWRRGQCQRRPRATIIGADHPDNPLGIDARLRYSAFDVGPRTVSVDNQFARLLVGVKGALGEWDYDVGYLHSETDLTSERNGYLRYSRVRDGADRWRQQPGRLVAHGRRTQASTRRRCTTTSRRRSAPIAGTKLERVDAKFSRSLMDLPGGPLGLALGAEWRRDVATLTPVTYTDQSDIIGLGYSAYDGARRSLPPTPS